MDMKGHVIVEYRDPKTGEILERSEGDNHVFVDQFKLNARPFSPGDSTSDSHFILMATDGTKELDESIPVLPGVICGGGTEYTSTASQPTAQAGYASTDSSKYWDISNDGDAITLKKTLVFDFLPNSPSNTTIRYVGLGLSPRTPWGYYKPLAYIGNSVNWPGTQSSRYISMFYDTDIGYSYGISNYANSVIQVVTLSTAETKLVKFSDIVPSSAAEYPIFRADSDPDLTNPTNYTASWFTAADGNNFYIYAVYTKYYTSTSSRTTKYYTKIVKYTCDNKLTACDSGTDELEIENPNRRYRYALFYVIHNGYFYTTVKGDNDSSNIMPIYRFRTPEDWIENNVETIHQGYPGGNKPSSIHYQLGIYGHYLIAHGFYDGFAYDPNSDYSNAAWIFDLLDFSIYSVFPDYISYPHHNSSSEGAYIVSVNKGVKGWLSQPYLPFNNLVTAYQIPNADSRPKESAMRIIYQITCKIH